MVIFEALDKCKVAKLAELLNISYNTAETPKDLGPFIFSTLLQNPGSRE